MDQASLEQSKHLLRTKFFVPPIRSSHIARSRLSDLIDCGLDRALILVSAPAGYGKTTLVSSWLKEKNIPSAWLSLDDGDNDPIRFLQYLIAALAPFAPGVEAEAPGMLRLSNLIDCGLDRALILVSAPAGYGKTTLVSSWLKEKKIPFAWLSLDSGDNDPIRFLQYLIAAMAPFAPDVEAEAPGMLQGIQPAQFETVINLLVNELASIPDPFVLVLDDLHLIQTETVLKILAFLLDHLPPQMHLALITRIDPPLPLARLRARNRLTEIRADQLRFTRDEIAAFLNDVMELMLSADDLSAIEKRTEGWIAGLQLAALSMQSSKDIHGFVSAFTGSHHYVMDYLVEEVLKSQPEKLGSFLLQTSILDKMCGPLCESVLDARPEEPVDGQAMLESLERMNLFVIPLDDERRWYRYHHLFADVLRKRLEQHYPDALPRLHARASQWFEQHGLLPEAIRHSLTGGDQERAIQLIEQNAPVLIMSGELNALSNWIKAVETRFQTHPWISHYQSLVVHPYRKTRTRRRGISDRRETDVIARGGYRNQVNARRHCHRPLLSIFHGR